MSHGKCKCSQCFILALPTSAFSTEPASFQLDTVHLQSWVQRVWYKVRLCVPGDAVGLLGSIRNQQMFKSVLLGLLLSLCLLWNLTGKSCLWLSPLSLRPVVQLFRKALLWKTADRGHPPLTMPRPEIVKVDASDLESVLACQLTGNRKDF